MLKEDQIWENTTRIAKLECSQGSMQAVIFKIRSSGLKFDKVITEEDGDLEKHLKTLRMHPTNKILTLE